MPELKTKRNDASIKGWLSAIADPERRKGKSCLYIKRMSDIDTGVLKEGELTMAIFMQRFGGQTYALMRIVSGFLFIWHGTNKLFDFPKPSTAPDWIVYGAGSIELIGGTLIMIGLLTTWAAFIASGLMAFAYFLAHAPQGFYPLFNGGEPAVLFCFIWLYVATRPPGPLALDNVFRRRSDRTHESSRLLRAS